MSALQKSIVKNKMPPRCPKTSGVEKLKAQVGAAKRKDYTPVPWTNYFQKSKDLDTDNGTFRVYLTAETKNPQRPKIITLHGGGYSGLSWAIFSQEITNMIECQVVSIDLRGHGETMAKNPDDLSADTLVKDVEQVLNKMYGDEMPSLVLVGHSMGGAVAVRLAHLASVESHVHGLAVIDVVEGTAMESLASMQSYLRGRPTHFRNIEHAIEWSCDTGLLATNEVENYVPVTNAPEPGPTRHAPLPDRIAEEDEEEEGGDAPTEPAAATGAAAAGAAAAGAAAAGAAAAGAAAAGVAAAGAAEDSPSRLRYKWRIDLSKTEHHWPGWFRGLSSRFLSVRAPKLLLLASIDGLDKELMVGQMQGKFQMHVMPRCGHAVHEDSPREVAQAIATFATRYRLTVPTEAARARHFMPGPGI